MRLRDNPPPYKKPRFYLVQSFLPVVITFGIVAFFLSSLSLLSHFRSPAIKQHLGWQSWEIVKVETKTSENGNPAGDGDDWEDEDWLEDYFGISLPLDDWDPLAPHTTGLTEIAINACYIPPWTFPAYCAPPSTREEEKLRGKWVIVERDLNVRTGLWYNNIYYRRTRRLDVPLITDLRIAPHPLPDNMKDELEGWTIAEGDLRSGVWPTQKELRLYYLTKEQTPSILQQSVSSRQRMASNDTITELDVIYGDDDPFFGFQRIQPMNVMEAKDGKWETVGISFRRGNYIPPKAKKPNFHADGTFKIMQIADLHYSVGKGQCKDADLDPCEGDADTANWLGEALDKEKPDMVVFSGDQLNGAKTTYDSRSVLAKFATPAIDREIAWTAIFGNHDSQDLDDRDYQMRNIMNMPYSLAKAGPKNVDGVGNYLIKIRSSDPSQIHLFTLYFLDSHAVQKKKFPWDDYEYDYIKQSQIDWLRNASDHISPISRPFQPDGTPDLGNIWRSSRTSKPRRAPSHERQTLAKPNAILFFHIPLPEAYDDPDLDENGSPLDLGTQLDHKGSSNINSHLLDKGILPQVAVEGDDGGVTEIKVTSHGHSHMTDRCRRIRSVWMCFDGGSSYSGWGSSDYPRRVRIYQLKDWGETIESYKRLTDGSIIDRQILVKPMNG